MGSASRVNGTVRTVLGDVDSAAIGQTSMHEHLLLDCRVFYTPGSLDDVDLREQPVSRDTLPSVRWNAFSCLDNLVLDDVDSAVTELRALALAGGNTILDLTSRGLGCKPDALQEISRRSNVHVVLGAGHYVHSTHEQTTCGATVEELETQLEREVTQGVGGSSVRPGVIGEIGMSAPPRGCEKRALLAAARVAARHGMSLHVHTDNSGAYGCDHVEDCAEAGLAPERIVICHMDERLDPDYHRAVLQTGANIAFDTFGSELNFSGVFHHPSDRERLAALVGLLEDGYADRIVLGHDVFAKAHLHAFGGYGYDHLIARIRPALEQDYGVNTETVDQMLIHNPRRLLALASSRTSQVMDERPRMGMTGRRDR